MDEQRPRSASLLVELTLCATLVLVAFATTAAFPHPVGHSDEGYFLQHTKRVLLGQVPYRDFHEQYTPLGYSLMAIPWRLFGVSVEVAAYVMATVHSGIALLIFFTARRLSAGPWFAAGGALLHLSLARPAWPMASGHWLAAFFLMLVFYVLACAPRDRGRSMLNLAVAGGCAGALIAVQYQKGIPVTAGVMALAGIERWLAPDRALARRLPIPFAVLVPGLASAGVALIFLLPPALQTGFGPLIDQFSYMLGGYAEVNEIAWGGVGEGMALLANSTSLPALTYMPALILIGAVRGAVAWRTGDAADLRKLTLLSTFGSFTALATAYRPDFVHLAMVASPFCVLAGEFGQWLADRLDRVGFAIGFCRSLPALVFAGALIASGLHLSEVAALRHERFPFSSRTSFGEVDFWSKQEMLLVREAAAAMDELPEREIFCYLSCASMYLLVDAANPTPFDLFFYPALHTRKHVDELLAVLEARRVRYIVHQGISGKHDPIVRYIKDHYVKVRSKNGSRLPLYRRRVPNRISAPDTAAGASG